jgi:hypothetical protein
VHSATLAVCVLDMQVAQDTTAGMFVTGNHPCCEIRSQLAGVVEGRESQRVPGAAERPRVELLGTTTSRRAARVRYPLNSDTIGYRQAAQTSSTYRHQSSRPGLRRGTPLNAPSRGDGYVTAPRTTSRLGKGATALRSSASAPGSCCRTTAIQTSQSAQQLSFSGRRNEGADPKPGWNGRRSIRHLVTAAGMDQGALERAAPTSAR